jgi:hypothetical protein
LGAKKVYNQYVEIYCDHHNLTVKKSSEVMGENYILENGNVVGFFKDNDTIVEFKKGNSKYRKGDLMLFLIEEDQAH